MQWIPCLRMFAKEQRPRGNRDQYPEIEMRGILSIARIFAALYGEYEGFYGCPIFLIMAEGNSAQMFSWKTRSNAPSPENYPFFRSLSSLS